MSHFDDLRDPSDIDIDAIAHARVYALMSEEDYFDQEAIGSSDLKTLHASPADWWYTSRHNEDYQPPADSPSRVFGRAIHCLLLEGREVFDARYFTELDKKDMPDNIAYTVEDIRRKLREYQIPFKSVYRKPELLKLVRDHNLSAEVYDTRVEDWNDENSRKKPLSAQSMRYLEHMHQLVEEHAEIGEALRTGLSEVSVFWRNPTLPGVVFRARFDSINAGFTLDLKSFSNWKGRTRSDSVTRQITEHEYDLQRAFYDVARKALIEAVSQGRIFHASTKQVERLKELAQIKDWVWVWLFYQIRDDQAGRAPVLIPRIHRPSGEVYAMARQAIAQALANYRGYVAEFGTDTPWVESEPMRELEDSDLINLQYKRNAA